MLSMPPRRAEGDPHSGSKRVCAHTSFFLSTPGVFEPGVGGFGISVVPGQFLRKDIGLLAVSAWAASRT